VEHLEHLEHLEHIFLEESSHLTNSIIFQRGRYTTNQIVSHFIYHLPEFKSEIFVAYPIHKSVS
jgi:hypothetical protein